MYKLTSVFLYFQSILHYDFGPGRYRFKPCFTECELVGLSGKGTVNKVHLDLHKWSVNQGSGKELFLSLPEPINGRVSGNWI